MGAFLAPFGIGIGCQAFLQARQLEAAKGSSSSANSAQPDVEHQHAVTSVLDSQVIGLPSHPSGPPWIRHAGAEAGGSSGLTAPSTQEHVTQGNANSLEEVLQIASTWQGSPRAEHEWAAHILANGQSGAVSAPARAALCGLSPEVASFYLSLCSIQRLASVEDMQEQHGTPAHTTGEALADVTLRVLHEHDSDLDSMELARMTEAPRPALKVEAPLPPPQPMIDGPLDDSWTSAALPSAPAAEAAAQKKRGQPTHFLLHVILS